MAKIGDADIANTIAENVMISSSAGMIPTLLELLMSEEYNGEMMDNCSVPTIKYKNGTHILDKVNNASYIE